MILLEIMKFLILMRLITYFRKLTGVILIQIITICCIQLPLQAQNDKLNISDFRQLGKSFYTVENYLLSYLNNLNYYKLSVDSASRVEAGLQAIDACIKTGNYDLAEQLIFIISADYPSVNDYLLYQYSYSLVLNNRYSRADLYLNLITDGASPEPQYSIIQSYNKINLNQKQTSLNYIETALSSKDTYYNTLSEIRDKLNAGPDFNGKSLFLSIIFSSVMPGSGQLYNGFYYDAFRSFGFNLLTGYATYASYRYAKDRENSSRKYIMPMLSGVVFGLFYVSNIYNTINLNRRAKLYHENQFYRKILNQFDIIISDKGYFLNVGIAF